MDWIKLKNKKYNIIIRKGVYGFEGRYQSYLFSNSFFIPKGIKMNNLRLRKIANKLIKSFEMTEEEWVKYKKRHPNAKRENHKIINKQKMLSPQFNVSPIKMTVSQAINYIHVFHRQTQ